MKRNCLLIFTLLITLMCFVGCEEKNNKQNLDNNNMTNQNVEKNKQSSQESSKSVKIGGIKRVGDIEISNIVITLEENNKSKVTAEVKNTSDKDLAPTNVEIKVVNEKNEIEETFGGLITELIWYETNTFTTYIMKDITEAKDLEFSLIEKESQEKEVL